VSATQALFGGAVRGGCARGLVGLLCLALLAFAVRAEAQVGNQSTPAAQTSAASGPLDPRRPLIPRTYSLFDLGYREGVSLYRGDGNDTVFLPVLRNVAKESGAVDIDLAYDAAVLDRSAVRVEVADSPRVARSLPPDGTQMTLHVPLTQQDLKRDVLPLTFYYRGALSDDRCFDERLVTDFLTLTPQTRVRYRVDPFSVDSLRAAWELLPPIVTISVGNGAMEPSQYAALLALVTRLQVSGRQVEVRRLPKAGDVIALADRDQLEAAAAAARLLGRDFRQPAFRLTTETEVGAWLLANEAKVFDPGDQGLPAGAVGQIVFADSQELRALGAAVDRVAASAPPPAGDGAILPPVRSFSETPLAQSDPNLRLVRFLDYPVILVDQPNVVSAASLLTSLWVQFATGPTAAARVAEAGGLKSEGAGSLLFSDLSFDGTERNFAIEGRWFLALRMTDMPAYTRPRSLDLYVSAAPSGDAKGVTMLMVYLNGVLLRSFRLNDDGRVQRVPIDLPPHLINLENGFRFVIYRQSTGGDCKRQPPVYPAQILDTSRVMLESFDETPIGFSDLPPWMRRQATLYLPDTITQQPLEALPLLSRVLQAVTNTDDPLRVEFYGPNDSVSPNGEFVLVGSGGATRPQAPVSLDQGHVVLSNTKGDVIFDFSTLARTALLQIAQMNGHTGVWIEVGPDGIFPQPEKPLVLGRGDVAAVDDKGAFLTFNSRRDTVVNVVYPDTQTWFDLFSRYRYWIFGLGWILLTFGFVLLLRRIYGRGSSES